MSDQSLQTPVESSPMPSPDPSPTPTPTPTPEPTPAPKSLINEDDPPEPKARVAPEKYEDFKLPDGIKLNPEALTKAHDLFKNLSLDQPGAQSLIDFHTAELARVTQATEAAGDDSFRATVEEWGGKLKSDPEIGNRLPKVKENLGKAYDVLVAAVPEKSVETRALVNEFKQTLDLTGIGNHPAFVKVFNRLAEMVIEPGHVKGSGPSAQGQGQANGANPGLAASMYGQPKP